MRTLSYAALAAALLSAGCGTHGGGAGGGPSHDAGLTDSPSDAADAAAQVPADPTGWRATGAMHQARANHSATLLPDGRVLVVGGETGTQQMLASVEVYDPQTEMWTALAPLAAPRSNHRAVPLADGRVLVVGGGHAAPIGQPDGTQLTGSCLLFDPATNQFTATGSLNEPRSAFGAVRLVSGDVLVVGGGGAPAQSYSGPAYTGTLATPLATAEVYSVATGHWTPVGAMKAGRISFTLTLMASGQALAAGGLDPTFAGLQTAETYDPMLTTWSTAASLPAPPREHHSASLLASGRVLIAGGKNPNVGPLNTVLTFDAAGTWSTAHSLPYPLTGPGLVALASGRTLLAGGYNQDAQTAEPEAQIFDEPTNAWNSISPMMLGRLFHTLTLLANGDVLVTGGDDPNGDASKLCERTVSSP